ncbi:MAG TPA: carboxypeptidase-like regulatory domain-containing protein [Thermoanaerobaculia bacterium]
MTTIVRLAVLLAVLSAPAAYAYKEFALQHGASQLAGGEVCFFKTSADATSLSPDRLFFADREVHCVPAHQVIEIPVGKFLFFGIHPDGFITPHRSSLSQPAPDSEECFSRVVMTAVPAAILDFGKVTPSSPGAYLGVWIEDTETMQSTFLPSLPGATTMQVPANVRFLPMEIVDRAPRRVWNVMKLDAGGRHELAAVPPSKGGVAITWLEGPDQEVKRVSGQAKLDPPALTLRAATGQTLTPVFAPKHLGAYRGTLVIFTDVPAGPAAISIGGSWWMPEERTVEVKAGEAVVTKQALPFAVASRVRIEQPVWASGMSFLDSCDDPLPRTRAVLLRCPERAACTPVREVEFEEGSDGAELAAIEPGDYVAEVRLPNGLSGREPVTATAGKVARARPPIDATVLYGTVRRGKEPVTAQIVFGTMEKTVTDAQGAFRVALRRNPDALPVEVSFCDGVRKYLHVPERPPSPYEAFDIVVPENSVTAHVTDAVTGAAIRGARARVAVRAPSSEGSPLFTRSALTDDSGDARIEFLPPAHRVVLCATADGYERGCGDPLVLPAEGEKSVKVRLAPAGTQKGRILGLGDPTDARVFFIAANGATLPPVVVREDGTFTYAGHGGIAYAVVVSPHAPLTLAPAGLPDPASGELVVRIPQTPPRRLIVRLGPEMPQRTARVGLIVGGVTIPPDALGRHQAYRGLQSTIVHQRTLEILDIAATGDIAVRLGPEIDNGAFPADAVARPEYVPVFPVAHVSEGQNEVEFGRN